MPVAGSLSVSPGTRPYGALLDVKLGESFCFPVCTILKMRKIPFVFMTGYPDLSFIPLEFRAAPVVWKPFYEDELRAAVVLIVHGYEPLIETQALMAEQFRSSRCCAGPRPGGRRTPNLWR